MRCKRALRWAPILSLIIAGATSCSTSPKADPNALISPATGLPITGDIAQKLDLEDHRIHFNADVVKPGVSREQVEAVLGPPDSSMALENEEVVAVYAFFPDGGKFMNPGLGPRYFSHSSTSSVSFPKLEAMRHELTFYRIRYNLDGKVMAVTADRPIVRVLQPTEDDTSGFRR